MSDNFYKPLTPKLRQSINSSIEENIAELKTCRMNGLVNMQIQGYIALRNLINALPDGYLIPMKRSQN